jgi:hypothetical protein
MKIPDELRKCVAFLGVRPLEGGPIKLRGTAFLVGIPGVVPGVAMTYLVTARHVAQRLEGREFFIRVNTIIGGSLFTHAAATERWWYHPTDASVDVAVIPCSPSLVEADFRYLPLNYFCTVDNMRERNLTIGVGDEVYIVGLFVRHSGNLRNIPIVRTGNIAAMPEEPVRSKDFGDMEAYLIEARSIGGLSGSPVFVNSSFDGNGAYRIGSHALSLLGLVHGHWDVPDDPNRDEVEIDIDGTGRLHAGIAVAVPASKILEVLNHPELIAIRDEYERSVKVENGPGESSSAAPA